MTKTANELTHLDVIRMMAKESEDLKQEMHILRTQVVAHRQECDKKFTELAEAQTQTLRLIRLIQSQATNNTWKHGLH